MPTLFRFLGVIGLIVGLFYGSIYLLATYFEPSQRELTGTVRDIKVK